MLPATGCAPPPPSHHCRVTTGPPSRHLAGAAPTPASTLLLCRNSERREGSSLDLRVTHTEVLIIDPNNGTRARLPLCNPNPNRVKEERKRDRGGGRHCLPVTTATAGGGRWPHRCSTLAHGKNRKDPCLDQRRREKNRTHPFGSEQRRGSLTLTLTGLP